MHEDSSFIQALMQSSMLESAKINERGKGSFFLYPNTAKLTKVNITHTQADHLCFSFFQLIKANSD